MLKAFDSPPPSLPSWEHLFPAVSAQSWGGLLASWKKNNNFFFQTENNFKLEPVHHCGASIYNTSVTGLQTQIRGWIIDESYLPSPESFPAVRWLSTTHREHTEEHNNNDLIILDK